MARNGPKRGAKKAYTRNKKSIQKSTGAKAQQKQLMSLQRQVTTLAKAEAAEINVTTMAIPTTINNAFTYVNLLGPSISEPTFNLFPLTTPNEWYPIFSTDQRVLDQKKAKILYYNLYSKISPQQSEGTLTQADVQIWLIKLRPESAQQFLEDTNDFSVTALMNAQPGRYWWCTTNDAYYYDYVKLNPKYFDIKAYKFCSLQNIVQETETVDDDVNVTNPSFVRKFVNIYQKTNNTIVNVKGDNRLLAPDTVTNSWATMDEEQTSISDRYYLLTHVGGYASDANGVRLTGNWTCGVRTDI